jgi:hypothetical protein
MPSDDWLRYAIPLAAVAGAVALLIAMRSISRRWAPHWAALRAQPRWLRWVAALALAWIGLRLARAGWRPLVVFAAVLVIAGLWGEVALRTRR